MALIVFLLGHQLSMPLNLVLIFRLAAVSLSLYQQPETSHLFFYVYTD